LLLLLLLLLLLSSIEKFIVNIKLAGTPNSTPTKLLFLTVTVTVTVTVVVVVTVSSQHLFVTRIENGKAGLGANAFIVLVYSYVAGVGLSMTAG